MIFPQAGKEATAYGRRGAAQSTAGSVYRIEGEYVTMREIAERLGINATTAGSRMAKLKKASGAVTWERLRA